MAFIDRVKSMGSLGMLVSWRAPSSIRYCTLLKVVAEAG